jgi:integrase
MPPRRRCAATRGSVTRSTSSRCAPSSTRGSGSTASSSTCPHRFNAAVIDGLRPDNPATPICRELHRRAGRRERRNYSSMPYRQVPAFLQRLGEARGTSPRCLEFTILTAARTSEALTAECAEFDRQARTWTIPAAKMKCHERHVVFLSGRALEILDGQEGLSRRFVFPSLAIRTPMSNMALLMTLRRLGAGTFTVRGFRSTFSTWGQRARDSEARRDRSCARAS